MYKRALASKAIFGLVAAFAVANQAYAVGNGMYIGLMFGPSTNTGSTLQAQQAIWCTVNPASNKCYPNTPKTPYTYNSPTTAPPAINYPILTTPVDPKSSQFGSRIYVGNQFNRYAAFELGLNYFTSISYDNHNVSTITSTKVTIRNADLSIVGIMPFGSVFTASLKGGVALIYETTSGDLNPPTHSQKSCRGVQPGVVPACTSPTQNYIIYSAGRNGYNTLIRPVFAIDLGYAINQSWVVDLQVQQIMTGGSAGNIQFAGLGLTYHFSDKYCGQFLCDE